MTVQEYKSELMDCLYFGPWSECNPEKAIVLIRCINSIEDVASGRYFYDFSLKDLSARQTMDLSHEDAEGIDVDAEFQIIEKALSIGTEGPYSDY